MTPRTMSWLTLRLVAAAFLIGCADTTTNSDEFTLSDLAGSWEGSKLSVTSIADSSVSFDLIASGGALRLAFQPKGSFSGTAVFHGSLIGGPSAGVVTVPLAGIIEFIDETTIQFDFIPEIPPIFTSMQPTFTYSETTFTVNHLGAEHDFDGDGEKEPAILDGILVRR